jgi:hypothetical protein
MAVGLSSANFADLILAGLTGSALTPTSSHLEAHTADPGASGTTANSTGITARQAIGTWSASSGTTTRQKSNSAAINFPVTGTDTITHFAAFDAITAGNFRWSVALTTPRSVINGDTLQVAIGALVFSVTPVAT